MRIGEGGGCQCGTKEPRVSVMISRTLLYFDNVSKPKIKESLNFIPKVKRFEFINYFIEEELKLKKEAVIRGHFEVRHP